MDVKICAILGIVVLEGIALFMGMDGVLLSSTIAVIAAIAGFVVGAETVNKMKEV